MRSPPPPSNERIQIINEEKQFTKELGAQIGRWGLSNAGFEYNLVAILGSQSTGKSTLLNKLFGTTFDVMDPARRRQTTKGIWMCRGEGTNIMVMDVEGTDGRERGEDQDFERKSALFTLASSEVLIVNLCENQVGLYQGANMGLLKTVFAVHSSLFGKNKSVDGTSSKTMLLFVIRDYEGETPLSDLSASLTADMQKMWDEVSEPQNLQCARLADHFDLEFTALPHKRYRPEKFDEEATNLRGRFVDNTREDYVFKPAYHRRIPADGVAHYMESIWEKVQSNMDLDLSIQQELLAQHRCDEIANIALQELDTQIKNLQESIENGEIASGLGSFMGARKSSALARFDQDALRYQASVYLRKREELFAQLNAKLRLLFLSQLKTLRSFCGSLYKQELLEGVKHQGYELASVINGAHEKWERKFREIAAEAQLPDTDWSYDEDLKLLQQEFRHITDPLRDSEIKRLTNKIARRFCDSIAALVEDHLNKPKMDMWDRLLEEFKNGLSEAEETYTTETKPLNCTDSANEAALKVLRKHAWRALLTKITEQTNENILVGTLREYFEESFRYNTNGTPRRWSSKDEVTPVFERVKGDTLNFIQVYAKIAPQDPSVHFTLLFDVEDDTVTDEAEFDCQSPFILLSDSKQANISTRVRRHITTTYNETIIKVNSKSWQVLAWTFSTSVLAMVGTGLYMSHPIATGVGAAGLAANSLPAQSLWSACSRLCGKVAARLWKRSQPAVAATDTPTGKNVP